MDSRAINIYFECLAKNMLESFMSDDYHDLTLSDAPDLRMGDSIGIEVTRAITQEEGQASGIFEHIRNHNIKDIDKRYRDTIDKNNFQLVVKDDTIIGYGPQEAIWVNDQLLKSVFIKKLKKISNYNVGIIDLFIFSPGDDWFEEDVVYGFLNWAIENGGSHFRRIIVYEYSYLYMLETANSEYAKIIVDRVKSKYCASNAKAFALSHGREV